MAELVDARDSKSRVGDNVGVRFPLPAPNRTVAKKPYWLIILRLKWLMRCARLIELVTSCNSRYSLLEL